MPLDLNIDPFYDDYDAAKNFLRILSRPGRAVQSRELTQAQSILQNQISSFANHIFKEGSSIIGARIKVNFNKQFFNVDALDEDTNPVDVSVWVGVTMVGQTSSASAIVTHYDVTTRSLYYYILSGAFVDAENLQVTAPSLKATMTTGTMGEAMFAHIEPGIAYVGSSFVVVANQEYIVNSTDNTGEYLIGFDYTEDIVTSDDDGTLLDPASGSFNYNAPGADRYRGRCILASYEVGVNTPPNNFIEVIHVKDGILISEQDNVQYAEILDLLARRTFDANGNYTIRTFPMRIDNHDSDATKLKVSLEAGKAYVLGYEQESIATTDIEINRARSYDTLQNVSNFMDFGPYIDIADDSGNPDIEGMFDISTKEQVYLFSGVDGSGINLGTARITAIIATATGLRAYFSEASTLTSLFSSVRSFESVANAGVYANVALDSTSDLPVLGNKGLNTAIFAMREDNIKETRDLSYYSLKSYTGVNNVADDFTINAPSTTIDFLANNGIVYVIDGDTGLLIPTSSYSYVINNLTAPGVSTLTVTVSGGPSTIDVLIVLDIPLASGLSKVLTEVTTTFTLAVSVTSKTLSNTDIFEITSVRLDPTGADVDLLSQAVLDNGSRDYYYDYGILSNLDDNVDYEITYKYFAHSGTGDYFSVDSYINATNLSFYSDIYDRIPNYTSQDGGNAFVLRDCIDFRRSVDDLAAGTLMVQPESTLRLDYDFYLPRIDKVYIDQYGNFGSIIGVPAITPEDPNDLENAMTLYKVTLPAYTFLPSDVEIELIDNKNFTMRDIGKLERRIESLEYFSALSLLEQDSIDMSILDSNGNNRFKNGIVVDDFAGHGIGNVYDENYNCAIDVEEGILRSPFSVENVDLEVKAGSTFVTEHDNTITLEYTTDTFVDQPNASEFINVNPYNVFLWVGTMNLDPDSDNWVDVNRRPDVVVNINGMNDGMKILPNWFGTRWNSWQTIWSGSRIHRISGLFGWGNNRVLRRTSVQRRQGRKVRVIPGQTVRRIGDRIIDTSIIPWMRSRTINWSVVGMKPDVNLIATFDGVDVDAQCTGLTTNSAGSASGTFAIPNTDALKFRTGPKIFRLADDAVNPTTSAETTFTSAGILQTKQNTIVSVTTPRIIQQDITATRQIITSRPMPIRKRRRWMDPIAESFLVDNNAGGVFLSDIELFFRSKSDVLPVTVYIVENDNGMPTQNIVPFSEVTLLPASVNTSSDGSVGTTFTFTDPVYLQDGVEYSFIIISNSNEYEAFIASIGGTDLISGDVISKQPYTGVMFKSQNASTWTPDQNKDIKFKMNRCVFTTSEVGTIEFHNELPASDIDLTTIMVNVDDLAMNDTGLAWTYRFSTDPYVSFEMKTNINQASQQTLNNLETAPRSFTAKGIMSTTNNNISPVINKKRASVITILNTVNIGTEDAGQYTTRFIALENPSDDLRVIFDSKEPSGTSVDVFFRTSEYIPRYVEISDQVYADWVSETKYVYQYSDVGVMTLMGSAVVTKIDSGTPLKIFLKEISNVGAFIAPADWVGDSLDATRGVLLVDDGDIIDANFEDDYGAGTGYVIGDYVFYTLKIYKCIQAGTGNQPDISPAYWTLVESSIIDDPTAGEITGTAIIEDAAQSWRPMVLESSVSASIDTEGEFIEYTYIPEDPIDEEFSSFAIKLELKSNTTVNVPEVKAFRALAVF